MKEVTEQPPAQEHDIDELLCEITRMEHLNLISDLHKQAGVLHLISCFTKVEPGKYSQADMEEAIDYCFNGRVPEAVIRQIKKMILKLDK